MPTQKLGLILSTFLLSLGLLLCTIFYPTDIKSEPFTIQLNSQHQLVGVIYTPKKVLPPYPVMVLCHGMNSNKEMMAALGIELARHAIASVTFDFGNFGESYRRSNTSQSIQEIDALNIIDAKAVLAFVRSQPERFDINRIGIGGHSMGGTAALNLAQEDTKLKSTIVLGIGGLANPKSPQNLLYAVGLYDQLNPVWELQDNLHEATNSSLLPFQLFGNFADGTARKLVISPTSEHITAPYNPFLIRQAVDWAKLSLNVISTEVKLASPWYIAGLVITSIILILCSIDLIKLINNYWRLPKNVNSLSIIIPAILIFCLTVGKYFPIWISNLMLFSYFIQVVNNYAFRENPKINSKFKIVGLYSILLAIALILPSLINGFFEIIKRPNYLVYFPRFILEWGVFLIYNITQYIKANLFAAYTFELKPTYFYGLLVIIELILPGITLILVEKLAVKIVFWLRQPLTIKGIGKSKNSLAILSLLLLVLAAIIYHRAQSGLLSEAFNRGLLALQLLLQLVVLPTALVILILRSPGFRYLENRCLKTKSNITN